MLVGPPEPTLRALVFYRLLGRYVLGGGSPSLRSSNKYASVIRWGLIAVMSVAALAQPRIIRVPPGGAPAAGTGNRTVRGFVRVIDGESIDVYVNGLRSAIRLAGIEAPPLRTACGQLAARGLQLLLAGGVDLEDDPLEAFDQRRRRAYHFRKLGNIVALDLLRAGLVRTVGVGRYRTEFRAAEQHARTFRRGCVWQAGAFKLGDPVRSEALSPADNQPMEFLVDETLVSPEENSTTGAGAARAVKIEPRLAAAPMGNAININLGFLVDVVASGLQQPTNFAFLPDGRILFTEQTGLIRIFKNGAILPTPFLDMRSRVNSIWDRGLLGLAVDPNFATNGYVYLSYTYEHDPLDASGPKTAQVIRVTAQGDTASLSSELVLVGTVVGGTGSCNDFPQGADCIPSDYWSHSVGGIRFASDGNLFVSLGEGANFNIVTDDALRSQYLHSLAGKLLRITPTGAGLPSNPFWTGDAAANQSKIFAYGMRNSFRFGLKPGSNVPFMGEVGWGSFEEINVATAGANLGWPCFEGNARQSGFEPLPVCQALYQQGPAAAKGPLVEIDRAGRSAAAVGGVFYTGTNYPAEYQGAFFYGDYADSTITYLKVDANNNLVGTPVNFATNAEGPVAFNMGPDGNLYYLAIVTGQLKRVRHIDGPDADPPNILSSTPANGSIGALSTSVSVTWTEAMDVSSLNASTFELRKQGSGSPVSATIVHTAATNTTVLDPVANLDQGGTYVVTIRGGASGARDLAGNTLVGDRVWTFTTVTPPPPGTSFVSDLLPISATNGWGPFEKDRSNGELEDGDGKVITLAGVTFQKGLGTHAQSQLRYPILGQCSAFTAQVGVDDEVGPFGSIVFRVQADGTTLYDSGLMTGSTATRSVNVNIQGKQELVLAVLDGGDGIGSDHGDWADAKITCTAAADTTPPTIATRNPASNATGVPISTGVVITFSEPMNAATVTTSTFYLQTGGNPVSASLNYDAPNRRATLQPYAPLTPSTAYLVTVKGGESGVKDVAGNPLVADDTWTFTTGSGGGSVATYLSDLTWTSMTNGYGPVEKDLSNGENAAGDGRPLTIGGTVYAKGLGTHAVSDVRYALGGACTSFAADVGVDDEVGNFGSVVFEVWADGTRLFASPVRRGTDGPLPISVNISGKNELRLRVLDGGDWIDSDHADWADARITCTATNAKPVVTIASPSPTLTYKVGDVINFSGSATDAEDGTIPSSNLSWVIRIQHCPSGVCHIHILTTVTGASGSFVIPDHGDESHFELDLTATDSGGLSETKTVVIQPKLIPITLATVPTGLQVVYGGIAGTSPLTRQTTAGSAHTIFAPSPQGGRTFLSWSNGGAQQHNVTVGETGITFTATFSSETTPPTIVSTAPVNGATAVPVSTSVSVVFSEAMNASSVNASTLFLMEQGTATPVAGTVNYVAATRTGLFQPTTALKQDTVYAASVKGGAGGVADIAGNHLAADQTWTFRTVASPPVDTTPPTVSGTTPSSGATGIATTAAVSAVFSENMLTSTINTSTVTLVEQGTTEVLAATVSYAAATRTVTLQPAASLKNSTTYLAKVAGGPSGVSDVAGNRLASDHTWTFQTVSAALTTRFLSDMTWIGTPINGYGPVEKDRSNGENAAGDGGPIVLNGVTHAKGLGVHAVSEIRYNLGGSCTSFQASVGVDDEVGAMGSVVFLVFADGVQLFSSGTMTGSSVTQTVDVDVTGRAELLLRVTGGSDWIDYDHADWASARLTCTN